MLRGLVQVPCNFSEDIRTIDRGPQFERSTQTILVYESDPQQYRTSLELKKRYVPSLFCTTLVVDLEDVEPETYKETMEVVPRILPACHGETVFAFEKEPRIVYTATVTYDTRSVDYWYTSTIDLTPMGSAEADAEGPESNVNGDDDL